MNAAHKGSRIVYFSRFVPDPRKGGGARRAHQVLKLLESLGADYQSILEHPNPVPPMTSPIHLAYSLLDRCPSLRQIVRKLCFWRWSEAFVHGAYNLTRSSWLWALCLDRYPNLCLVLIDDPLLLRPLAMALKRRKIMFAAVVHNLESLASHQVTSKYRLGMLKRELALLKDAAACITISREESVLLCNLEIRVHFLPYCPSPENLTRLARIRNGREKVRHTDLLMLGNAFNVATLVGMREFLSLWDAHTGLSGIRLHVAGFGTEQISSQYTPSKGVILHGSMSEDELDELLVRVKGCVCYQPQGSGAMTKIQELSCAGIPVFANEQAARSYYDLPGMHTFADLNELQALIENQNSSSPPTQASLPRPATDRLLTSLSVLMKGKK